MVKSGIGFLVGSAVAVGVGLFVLKNASASTSGADPIVRTRKAVPPFSPPHSPQSLRNVPLSPSTQDPNVQAMQAEMVTWYADDRNIILAPDGSRVFFPAALVTGVEDLSTLVATWIFQTWNNTFMIDDPNGVELTDPDGLPDPMTLAAIQRYNRS